MFVEEFLTKHAVRKSPESRNIYRRCLATVTKTLMPRRVGDVTTGLLEDFANARLAGGLAPATVNKELRCLRAALRWAWRRELVHRVPDFGSVFIRVDAKQPVTIPEDDFLAMIAALKQPDLPLRIRPANWWRVFLYLAYYLGLRRGELLGLTWERVRFDTLEVVVSALTSKGRKDRVLPMAPELASVLREWQSRGPTIPIGNTEVLPWDQETYRQLYKDWHLIQSAAGIPEGQHYVPKNCRSSCASELIAAGVPTAVVKDFLGHATVATTERYYINTQPAMRAVVLARKVRLA